ncbi:helix-turn-helix transcriptional regulator [Rhodovulum sp. MB263]|uniref:ArsR/SmtB family transcription factor n=1 Tax=unclassified Rhodovulum TaxID=2631432 RepID=UPI0009B747E2|nr:metalloregulator ArsR/SmtB family transcription factor [Rhodovulum sp. MB263]ARC90773.1 transcriptional regulator [Rhodovulum sp. MB263]
MEQSHAIDAFGALAHDARLAIFRLLVQRGPGGTPAMEIGRLLELRPSTLSGHLATLKRAGLVTTERRHREILYAPCFEAVNGLVHFLLQDCCGGDSAACAGAPADILAPKATPVPD